MGGDISRRCGRLRDAVGLCGAHLQDSDLLVRRERLEHEVELGLLLHSLRRAASRAASTRGHHHHAAAAARRRVNVEGLLNRLDQLGGLQQRHRLQLVHDLIHNSAHVHL